MNTKPETPPPGFAGLVAQEAAAADADQVSHPQGRLILGMEAARDLLRAEAGIYDHKVDGARAAYELAACLLDAKITDLKEGT